MKASARTLLRVELHGVDLPGRSCGPRPGGGWYEDIQVGLKRGTTAIDLFAEVVPALIDQALQTGRPLVGRVVLTDEDGWPRCARVHPPAIAWSIGNPDRSAHSSESGS